MRGSVVVAVLAVAAGCNLVAPYPVHVPPGEEPRRTPAEVEAVVLERITASERQYGRLLPARIVSMTWFGTGDEYRLPNGRATAYERDNAWAVVFEGTFQPMGRATDVYRGGIMFVSDRTGMLLGSYP